MTALNPAYAALLDQAYTERARIKAELDHMDAVIYGLTRAQLERIEDDTAAASLLNELDQLEDAPELPGHVVSQPPPQPQPQQHQPQQRASSPAHEILDALHRKAEPVRNPGNGTAQSRRAQALSDTNSAANGQIPPPVRSVGNR